MGQWLDFLVRTVIVVWGAALVYKLYQNAQLNRDNEIEQADYRSFLGYHIGMLESFMANKETWIESDVKVDKLLRSLEVLPLEYVKAFYDEFKYVAGDLIRTKGKNSCYVGCTDILACCLQIIESQSEAESKTSAKAMFETLSTP